jgi:UDP-N-acetylmuramyl pentapeptide phosphotransferase/UDP-N-acetylglucosamine-1-phosphate transferase
MALKFGVVDQPNFRSSHSTSTVRGGGILFPFALFLWWFAFDFQHTWLIIGMTWISAISLLDDIYTLSSKLRFGVQFLALSMAFFDLDLFSQVHFGVIPFLYFVCLGIINAINFMDGINGITGLYGVVFFGTILAVNAFMPIFEESMIRYILLSLFVFLIFNFRDKALMFAGDIGSISLAFLIIYFLMEWYILAQTWTIILLLAVYGIDVAFTMVERIRKGEKLSEPHRSHLYQLLANQAKISHTTVAIIYAFLQGMINLSFFIHAKNHHIKILNILKIYIENKKPRTIRIDFIVFDLFILKYSSEFMTKTFSAFIGFVSS